MISDSLDSQKNDILDMRKQEVMEYFKNYDGDNSLANAELRKIISFIVVDHSSLDFYWKHPFFQHTFKNTHNYAPYVD